MILSVVAARLETGRTLTRARGIDPRNSTVRQGPTIRGLYVLIMSLHAGVQIMCRDAGFARTDHPWCCWSRVRLLVRGKVLLVRGEQPMMWFRGVLSPA
jgi:hypothetical protein